MIQEDKEVWHRYFILFMMTIVTATGVLSGALIKDLDKFKWMALLLCGVLSSLLINLSMEWNRLQKGYMHEKANNYKRIIIYYIAANFLTLVFLFLPNYIRPVALLSALMTLASNMGTGMISGIYFSLLLCLCSKGSAYLLSCYLLLSICGCIIIKFFDKKDNLIWNSIFTAFYSCCTTITFSYLEKFHFSAKTVVYGLVNGILSALFLLFIHHFFRGRIEHKKEDMLEKIIRDDFELVLAMRDFSQADYGHARKVSKIARECADLIGADPHIAAAGGFYYRLGRLEGEPYVENGVLVARANNFPLEVIHILGEYNGEKKLPSTLESALVHIIDNVITRYEILDKTTLKSSWNQDIVVYQTLNEKSAQGLYDKAGLSMNMYLKIRDYLIKEADLY